MCGRGDGESGEEEECEEGEYCQDVAGVLQGGEGRDSGHSPVSTEEGGAEKQPKVDRDQV